MVAFLSGYQLLAKVNSARRWLYASIDGGRFELAKVRKIPEGMKTSCVASIRRNRLESSDSLLLLAFLVALHGCAACLIIS
jgi:hypothetical protein